MPRLGSYTIRNSNAEIDAALNGMMSDLGDGNVGFCKLNVIIEGLDLNGGTWLIRLHKASDSAADVIATKYDSASIDIMARSFYAGVWEPWGWVNPPTKLGVEYRTTERYLGKPVYVKAFDFGALLNTGTKNVSHGCNANAVIRWSGCDSIGNSIPYNYKGERYYICCIDTAGISVTTNFDASARTAVFTLWYTKTTD